LRLTIRKLDKLLHQPDALSVVKTQEAKSGRIRLTVESRFDSRQRHGLLEQGELFSKEQNFSEQSRATAK